MRKKRVVCIGAALIDECFSSIDKPVAGTSNPSTYFKSTGGVAGNIANHLSLLGNDAQLRTQVAVPGDSRRRQETDSG